VAAIGISIAAMVLIGLAGPSAAVPAFRSAAPWPPYFGHLSLSPVLVAFASWAAVLVGGAGVGAGLVAAARGWRPRPRNVIIGAILAVVALALVPPVGSTDMLDYAIYGRIAALGHSPYVMTPFRLKAMGDPVGAVAPIPWQHDPSVYGPLATVTEKAASLLGGASVARTLLWLKVWNGLAFLGIAIALDRLLRSDPRRRLRAHLLWSVNPLMLLAVMTGGHIDGLAAAFGLLGLLAFRRADSARQPSAGQASADQASAGQASADQPSAGQASADREPGVGLRWAVLAGVLVGAAVAVKAPFALFAIGLAWAGWRSVRTLAAAGLGLAVVLVPSYRGEPGCGRRRPLPALAVAVPHARLARPEPPDRRAGGDRGRGPGRVAATADARGPARPARDPGDAGPEPGLAGHLAAAAPLVRRDDLPAAGRDARHPAGLDRAVACRGGQRGRTAWRAVLHRAPAALAGRDQRHPRPRAYAADPARGDGLVDLVVLG
jgi:hypothetical protein